MRDDLIDRLRTITSSGCNPYSACHEAAAELSRLRTEVERLTGALEGALADSARLTLALADERRHADALADTLYSMDGLQKIDCEMRDNAVQQHRARRQG